MSNIPKVDDNVAWNWGTGVAEGVVVEVSTKRTEIISNGKRIVRKGTEGNPAVVIQHKNGNEVLKLSSELMKSH